MKGILPLLALLVPLVACQGHDPESQATDIAADNQILREANAAASSVVQAAGDCTAVKAAIDEANRKLDEAERQVRTPVGRTTINTLKKQVRTVADACP